MARLNKDLFRKVAQVIRINPGSYDQSCWAEDGDGNEITPPAIELATAHACGTKFCIAGWGIALTPPEQRPQKYMREQARQLFGLSKDDADYLFDSEWVPRPGVSVPDELERIADEGIVY